ncbi:hypothetical protein Fmac_028371 [Flemingia macrophylla]|uniref:Uncharacterized protein n=1 Tax=Flemingia macrophylla TaxID=520843 RepID=A0ABD1L7B7_9FABA
MALQFLKHPVTITRVLHNEPACTFLSRLPYPKLPFTDGIKASDLGSPVCAL